MRRMRRGKRARMAKVYGTGKMRLASGPRMFPATLLEISISSMSTYYEEALALRYFSFSTALAHTFVRDGSSCCDSRVIRLPAVTDTTTLPEAVQITASGTLCAASTCTSSGAVDGHSFLCECMSRKVLGPVLRLKP